MAVTYDYEVNPQPGDMPYDQAEQADQPREGIPAKYVTRVAEVLGNYGHHRDELFMTRQSAKEAEALLLAFRDGARVES